MGLIEDLYQFVQTPSGALQTGGFGMSAISDIMGAYSRAQQESRQRDIYNKLKDPNQLMSLYAPMSDAGQGMVNRNLNANNATMGLSPDSGVSQQHVADAWAGIEQQRQQQAVNQYIQALTGAGGNTGQAAGGTGQTGQFLQQMMIMRALQGQNKETGQGAPSWWSGLGGGQGSGNSWLDASQNMPGGLMPNTDTSMVPNPYSGQGM